MSSSNSRHIDKVATVSPRPKEMQVLAFGFSRTGTMSMRDALNTLGYKSYHMLEGAFNPHAFDYWYEALRAKYAGEGKPYERAEFDKLLGNYSAVTDIPCILFVDELRAVYPDAKIILTERDVDSWMVSMEKTLYVLMGWWSMYYLAPFEPNLVGPYWKTLTYVMGIWTGGNISDRNRLRQSYRDHYAHVRAVIPRDEILEFKPQDGWEPLCKFLGKPIPSEPFPHVNRPDDLLKMQTMVWWWAVIKTAQKVGGTIAAIGIAAGAVWYARNRV